MRDDGNCIEQNRRESHGTGTEMELVPAALTIATHRSSTAWPASSLKATLPRSAASLPAVAAFCHSFHGCLGSLSNVNSGRVILIVRRAEKGVSDVRDNLLQEGASIDIASCRAAIVRRRVPICGEMHRHFPRTRQMDFGTLADLPYGYRRRCATLGCGEDRRRTGLWGKARRFLRSFAIARRPPFVCWRSARDIKSSRNLEA